MPHADLGARVGGEVVGKLAVKGDGRVFAVAILWAIANPEEGHGKTEVFVAVGIVKGDGKWVIIDRLAPCDTPFEVDVEVRE